jgi:5-methyltetrahydropteroyltriglutamate--homocysteine methyltransferase
VISREFFHRLTIERFLLEYDDHRSGTFEPLKDIPDDKFVVLGLVSTKTGRLESVDELRNRVASAAQYFPLAQLGLSTQCGFASSLLGNPISPGDQRRKLDLVVKIARDIWS